MIKRCILFLILLNFSCNIDGQSLSSNIERVVFDNNDQVYGYYNVVKPISEEIKATLVLLPGFGQKAEDVFRDSKLHEFARENGILTISYSTGMRMFTDSLMQSKISEALSHAISKYKLNNEDFAFGGFSAGGMICLRYTELCKEIPDHFPVNPKAVFMADAPIDIFHSWNTLMSLREAANSQIAVDEANWIEKMYLDYYGTNPTDNPEYFESFNPFFFDDTKELAPEKHLKEMAVRAYHDVDVAWRLDNRKHSAKDCNYMITSEFIKSLRVLGNERAEFVQSFQTGYRSNGQRHPHSWSIIDEKECIQWVLKSISPDTRDEISIASGVITPILIDQQNLSGLNMKRGRNPGQPDRILFFNDIFRGEDIRVQVISSENASANPENLEIDEFLFLLNGGARLIPKGRSETTFVTGDFFIVPRGYNGYWETVGAPSFHHEISVTTANRNETSPSADKLLPVLMDKGKIAGIGITEIEEGIFYDVLYDGHELSITIEGEVPRVRELRNPMQEQVLHIVSGRLSLWDANENKQVFNKGDFIIIPQGFVGTWQSESQELFRFLKMTKSVWE